MSQMFQQFAPILNALTSIFLWSSLATIGARVTHVPPFLLVGITLGIGSLLSLRHYKSWFSNLNLLVIGVIGIFGYHFMLFLSFRYIPVAEAILINYLWPILIVLLTAILLNGYKLKIQHILGAAISLIGAFLILFKGFSGFTIESVIGYLLAFGAALTWALYSVLTNRFTRLPTATVGGFCLVSAVLAITCHILFEPAVILSKSDIFFLLFLGIGPMGIAFYTWDYSLKKGDPRQIGTLSYLTPFLSITLLSIYEDKFQFAWTTLASLICIVGGALIGSYKKQ